jgi:hypothetical protein
MYRIQVRIGTQWQDLRPAGGQPYRYPTKQEAEHMRRLCYPDQVREERLGGDPVTRVVEEDC